MNTSDKKATGHTTLGRKLTPEEREEANRRNKRLAEAMARGGRAEYDRVWNQIFHPEEQLNQLNQESQSSKATSQAPSPTDDRQTGPG